MELVSHVFPVSSRQQDEVLLMPVGDVQWYGDEKGVALGMLQRHIQWGVDHGAWFLGMGDYIDAFSPSNRQRIRSAALYDTANAVIEAKAKELVDELYEKALAPSKGRWLGLLEGHHFLQMGSGITTDQMLADKLGARFLGTSAYVRLQFRRGSKGSKAHSMPSGQVLIWCHHGCGTGQTPAAVLNKLKAMASGFEGDIFLMGHLPRKVNEPMDRLEPIYPAVGREPFLVHRTKVLAGTGGFMKGWVAGSRQGIVPRGGYPEQGMMAPAALGGILVRIRPRWKVESGHDVWLPDISVEA